MKTLIFRIAILAVILAAGWIAVFNIPEAVESFLPVVETVQMTPVEFNRTVTGSGIITQTPDGWYVTVAIGESDIGKVSVGQSAALSGAAFDDGIFTATVERVSDIASHQQTQFTQETVVSVTLKIDNPYTVIISGSSGTTGESGGILRSGYSARADIFTDEPRTVFIIPYSVINQDDIGEFVFVLAGNKAIRRNILTGIEMANGAEVVSGLRISDNIISNPASISENALVNPAP